MPPQPGPINRILITGASGFVGRHLMTALGAAFPGAALLTPRFDVRDAAATEQTVRAAAPDACVHLAAVAAVPQAQREPDLAWDVNLRGTLNLARALLAHAPGCTLLYPSSGEAYGASFKSGVALTEDAAQQPMNTYGATKAAADIALGALGSSEALRVIRARPFNHTGPGQSADFAIPAFARQVMLVALGRQPPVLRVGALDALRDFLDVRDVCDAYVRCLQHAASLPPGVVLNIASGTPRRIGDVLDALIRVARVNVKVELDPARLRPSEIPSATGDASRARDLLGWAPRIPWEQTLTDVLADWRNRAAAG